MNKYIPPGYRPLLDFVSEHGAEAMRDKLYTGEYEAFRHELDGSMHSIFRQDWAGHLAEHWLSSGKWFSSLRHDYSAPRILVKLPEPKLQDSAPEPSISPNDIYLSPFMEIMLAAIKLFAIDSASWPKKHELIEHFQKQKLPDGSAVSPNQAEHMATFCRPFEAMKGGQKRVG